METTLTLGTVVRFAAPIVCGLTCIPSTIFACCLCRLRRRVAFAEQSIALLHREVQEVVTANKQHTRQVMYIPGPGPTTTPSPTLGGYTFGAANLGGVVPNLGGYTFGATAPTAPIDIPSPVGPVVRGIV